MASKLASFDHPLVWIGLVCVVFFALVFDYENAIVPADEDLDFDQMVRGRGYPCEIHQVTTKDGYILTVYRIPAKKTGSTPPQAVILQHGLLDSAFT